MTDLNIYVLGAVRGLVSEGDFAASQVRKLGPNVVGLSISKEAIMAMESHIKEKKRAPEPANFEEEMYIEGLSEYGEILRPPPCFSMAWEAAKELKINVWGLDMDDEHFTSAFCKHISSIEMMRQGRCNKKWARHAFVSKTPKEFVAEWDKVINWLPGYKNLEAAREECMAKNIARLAREYRTILAIIEYERLGGVVRELEGLDLEFQVLETDA